MPVGCDRPGPAVSVVVASYGRPDSLGRCLDGIDAQSRGPSEVLVVARRDDHTTTAVVSRRQQTWRELRLERVVGPGLVAALNRGLSSARGEIIAFVDDDAVPRQDWLARITSSFVGDARIAAVGGRDLIHTGDRIIDGPSGAPVWAPHRGPTVGHLQWFGRMTANHHAGSGPPRDVDVVKGTNMAYRRTLLVEHGFDGRMRGGGSQVHNEASACLPLLRRGYRIVYDPAIVVDHYPAERPSGDPRGEIEPEAVADTAHNYLLSLLDHLSPRRRRVLLAWMLLVGTGATPGLLNGCRLWLRGDRDPWRRTRATQNGVLLAVHTWRRVPRPPVTVESVLDLSPADPG